MNHMVRLSNITSYLHFWNVSFWIMEYLSFNIFLVYLLSIFFFTSSHK